MEGQQADAANLEMMHRARKRTEEESQTTVRLRMVSGFGEVQSIQLLRSSTRSRVIVDLVRDDQLESEIVDYTAERMHQAETKNYEGGVAPDPMIKRVHDWSVSVTIDAGEVLRAEHMGLWAGGSATPNRAVWLFEHIPANLTCTVSLADSDGPFFSGRFRS